MIDIFIPAGSGPRKASLIADKLDKFLVGKSVQAVTGKVQFGNSTLSHLGLDADNPSLHRSSYSITFNLGVV